MRQREPVLWISAAALGAGPEEDCAGETFYEEDLPACCHAEATRSPVAEPGDAPRGFECAVCGAGWRAPLPVEPEFDAFSYRVSYHADGESEGVA